MIKRIEEELRMWFPRNFQQWLLVLVSLLILTAAVLLYMSNLDKASRQEVPFFLRSEFVFIYDHEPIQTTIDRYESFFVSYLYLKNAECYGSVSYHVRTVSDEILSTHTYGPYASGWPSSSTPVWISQQFPESISALPSGEYEVYWQVIGTCEYDDVFTRGPITRLTIR